MNTFLPVFGFRPTLEFLWRILKLPKPLISTSLPSLRESVMLDKNVLTTNVVFFWVSFVLSATRVIKSVLIIYLSLRFKSLVLVFKYRTDTNLYIFDNDYDYHYRIYRDLCQEHFLFDLVSSLIIYLIVYIQRFNLNKYLLTWKDKWLRKNKGRIN